MSLKLLLLYNNCQQINKRKIFTLHACTLKNQWITCHSRNIVKFKGLLFIGWKITIKTFIKFQYDVRSSYHKNVSKYWFKIKHTILLAFLRFMKLVNFETVHKITSKIPIRKKNLSWNTHQVRLEHCLTGTIKGLRCSTSDHKIFCQFPA